MSHWMSSGCLPLLLLSACGASPAVGSAPFDPPPEAGSPADTAAPVPNTSVRAMDAAGARAADGSGARDAFPPTSADAGVAVADSSRTALTPGTTTMVLSIAGLSRSVYLHVPSGGGSMPLVIALHGDGDMAASFVATSGLATDADQERFVLAAPQGITRDVTIYEAEQPLDTVDQVDWDAYNSIAADGSIVAEHNDDIPLLDAIREQLVASGSVDASHIVVYGYSQGGYLAFRYGMSAASSVACAAVISAATPLPGTTLVESASRKIPVFLQIGADDGAIAVAEQTEMELQSNGNPVQLVAVPGAGHVPLPGNPKAPLDYCLATSL
jgi:predicted esterase